MRAPSSGPATASPNGSWKPPIPSTAPPAEESAGQEQAKNDTTRRYENSLIEGIRGNETLRREAERLCDGAEKDEAGQIKDQELAEQCGKLDKKYQN